MPKHNVRLDCHRCGDTGAVLLDEKIADDAKVQWAYRCDCPAGAYYRALPLVPRDEQESAF